jgi:hypothetical protein
MAVADEGGCVKDTTKLFHYHGKSMWPCFQDGDLLEIIPVQGKKIRTGDCVVYCANDGQMVVHRVIDIDETITTQGDALQKPDLEKIKPGQIHGRVACRYRMGRKTSVWNGKLGQLTGFFYRYAGRIDPQRMSRGGRVARAIQGLSTFFLKTCRYKGTVKTFRRTDGEDIRTWEFYKLTVAQQSPTGEEWRVSWPWKIILKAPGRT